MTKYLKAYLDFLKMKLKKLESKELEVKCHQIYLASTVKKNVYKHKILKENGQSDLDKTKKFPESYCKINTWSKLL